MNVAGTERRFAVLLNDRKIGTVNLDPSKRGTVTARLAPLPAFRAVSGYRRQLAAARKRDTAYPTVEPTAAELAAEDGAGAVLRSLRLSLADDRSGRPVDAELVRLLQREPPTLRIKW